MITTNVIPLVFRYHGIALFIFFSVESWEMVEDYEDT